MNNTKFLNNNNNPRFGWDDLGNGWLIAPNDFAQDTSFISNQYQKFAERMRARWDLIEYVRTVIKQK